MADLIGELNAVLVMCRINNAVTCTNNINQEGFMQLEDIGVLEMDADIMENAKRMAMCTQAEGRVLLGTHNSVLVQTHIPGSPLRKLILVPT
jgi:hypothetical protein